MKFLNQLFKFTLILIIGLIALIVGVFGHQDLPFDQLMYKYGQYPSAFVEIDGMNVHYRDEGPKKDSIPIVLIHGTGASLHTFDEWTSKLKQKHRVIRMDLPAYGLTGAFPDGDYAVGKYVSFVQKFLESQDIDQCVLAGNSLGGEIAWNFALAHPSKVNKLILIDAAGYPNKKVRSPIAFKLAKTPFIKNIFTYITPRVVVESSVRNVYFDQSKVSVDLIDRYFELAFREGNRQAFIDKFGAIKDTLAYRNIKHISQPTLILWGEYDMLIPVENAIRFQNDLPNDTLVIISNVGHVPMEESPSESLKSVVSFLKGYSN